jgi:hypothetical protein
LIKDGEKLLVDADMDVPGLELGTLAPKLIIAAWVKVGEIPKSAKSRYFEKRIRMSDPPPDFKSLTR